MPIFHPENYIILLLINIVSDAGLILSKNLLLLRQLVSIFTSLLEPKKHQKLRIHEIRFLAKIEELVLLMWRPYLSIYDHFIFS